MLLIAFVLILGQIISVVFAKTHDKNDLMKFTVGESHQNEWIHVKDIITKPVKTKGAELDINAFHAVLQKCWKKWMDARHLTNYDIKNIGERYCVQTKNNNETQMEIALTPTTIRMTSNALFKPFLDYLQRNFQHAFPNIEIWTDNTVRWFPLIPDQDKLKTI